MAGLGIFALEQVITGTLYVALFTEAPNYAGGGTECSYAGYARVSHATWTTFTSPDYAERRNSLAVEFAAAADGAKDLSYWGLFDAAVGGNLIAWGPLLDGGGVPALFTLESGDQARIVDQDLRIRVV